VIRRRPSGTSGATTRTPAGATLAWADVACPACLALGAVSDRA
jgi:hypothetical protein